MDSPVPNDVVKLSYFQKILGPRKIVPNQMKLTLDDVARNLLTELFRAVPAEKFHDNLYFNFEDRLQRTLLSNGQFHLASADSLWVYEICSNQGALEHWELREADFWGSLWHSIPQAIRKQIQDGQIQLRISSLAEGTTVGSLLPVANLLRQHRVPTESVVFGTSALFRSRAISEFERQTGYKIHCLPYFEAMTLNESQTGKRPARKGVTLSTLPTKKFLLLNRRIEKAPHRVAFFLELLRCKVADQGHISMTWQDLDDPSLTFQDRIQEIADFPVSNARDQLMKFGWDYFANGPQMLPLKLDTAFDSNEIRHSTTSDHHSDKIQAFYNDSYFSIVPEGFWNSGRDLDLDSPSMISEKVFFAMLNRHPFLIVGEPHSLARLQEYGYQTFSRWWDESYDNILDPVQRIQALGQLTAELCKRSDMAWKQMTEEMTSIFEHNIATMKLRMDKALVELASQAKTQKERRKPPAHCQNVTPDQEIMVALSHLHSFIGPRGPVPNKNKPTAFDLIREFADDDLAKQSPMGKYGDDPYFQLSPHFKSQKFASSQSHLLPAESLWVYEIHSAAGFARHSEMQMDLSEESPWSWVPENVVKLINQGQALFLVSSMSEHFNIASAAKLAQGLEFDGAPAPNTLLLTSCMPRAIALEEYYQHTKIKLLPIPYSEARALKGACSSIERDDSAPNLSQKKFLMLNRELRNHPLRVAIFLELARRGLLKHGYLSMPWKDPDYPNFLFKDRVSEIGKLPPTPFRDELLEFGKQFHSEATLPLELDTSTWPKSAAYLKNTYFSVLSERFYHFGGEKDDLAASYFSEKTFAAMLGLHPFVFVGEAFSLERLKEHGYQTFSNWWDESYDSIADPSMRICAVADLIQSLTQLSDHEWEKMKQEMLPVLQHNAKRVHERVRESAAEFLVHQKNQIANRSNQTTSASSIFSV